MERQALRIVCEKFFQVNSEVLPKSTIIAKFHEFGVPTSTAYRYYDKLLVEKENGLKSKAGRPKLQHSSASVDKVMRRTKNRIFPGFRAISRIIGHDPKTAKRMVQDCGIKMAIRKKVPKTTEKQKQTQVERLPKLKEALRGQVIVMDDETYFDLDGHNFYGGQYFGYTECADDVPLKIRYREKAKFGKKLLLWIAVSREGISKPYFHLSQGAMDSAIYIEKCIQEKLLPFLKSHHVKRMIFWPDLASAHYSKRALAAYEKYGINFVSKDSNPPNCPMLRPIETFWAHLNARVYSDGFRAENVDELISRVKSKLKTFDSSYFKRLMINIKPKIDRAIENGPLSIVEKL